MHIISFNNIKIEKCIFVLITKLFFCPHSVLLRYRGLMLWTNPDISYAAHIWKLQCHLLFL